MNPTPTPSTTPPIFHHARASDRRLKLFLWGDSGVGKTTLALQFPKPVVIDLEGGTDLYGDAYSFDRLRTTDADAAMEAIDWLRDHKHAYETLIIDPISVYWEALQHKWSEIFLNRNRQSRGFKFEFYEFQMRDWMVVKSEMREFVRKLIAVDLNVVVTARQKTLYAEGALKALGETFDGEKSLPYLFDVVVRLYRDEKRRFLAVCQKDRSGALPAVPFEVQYATFEKCLHRQGASEAPPIEAQPAGAGGATPEANPTTRQEETR
jgi:hypothetical protein